LARQENGGRLQAYLPMMRKTFARSKLEPFRVTSPAAFKALAMASKVSPSARSAFITSARPALYSRARALLAEAATGPRAIA
jgi:hypothetical protein